MLIVHQFSSVLFQMQTFNPYPARFSVFQINIDIAVGNNRVIRL